MSLTQDVTAETQTVTGTVTCKNQDGAGTNLTSQANGTQRALDVGIDVAGVQVDPRAIRTLTTTDAVTAIPGTLTKGTQGAIGYTVQSLIDAGRNQTNYFMAIPVVSTATDALMSLTGYKGGLAVAATTTPAVVTAGKVYRIQSIIITYVTIVTTPGAVQFSLRCNLSGVVAITSPLVATWVVGEPTGVAPVAGKYYSYSVPIPDGMEFPAAAGIGVSMVGRSATATAAVVGFGHITMSGYEY